MASFDKLPLDVAAAVFTWKEYKLYVFPVVNSCFKQFERESSIWNAWNVFGTGNSNAFLEDLTGVVGKFRDDDVIDQSDLNKIDKVVGKYSSYFGDDQKKLMDAVKNGMESRAESMKKNFKADLSEVPVRTLTIFLTDYEPHAGLSNEIKKFCDKCEQELGKYYEEDSEKQLQGGDPKNMEEVKKRIGDGKKAYQDAIKRIREIAKIAKK